MLKRLQWRFNVRIHPHWPLHADVVNHPPLWLASCHTIWEDTSSVEEDWLSACVVNQHLVFDPIIWQPSFDLPHQTFTLLNFHTGQGPYRACLHKWGLVISDFCDCSHQQPMNHIVDMYPLMKFDGGLTRLHCSQLAEQYGEDRIREIKWNGNFLGKPALE